MHILHREGSMFRTDGDIQHDVIAELRWEPGLRHDDIAVAVRDGVVTLAGYVKSYAAKYRAERVAIRVKGVRGVANDLEVKLPSSSDRPDPEIARAAADALKWDIRVPDDRITVKVRNGWVTLEGTVDLYYEREAAERAVHNLTGVKGISNLITIAKRPATSDVRERIKDALERGAQFDAERVTVEVDGSKVVLRGTVRSFVEKRDAERAARNATGVMEVENKLTVDPSVPAPI